MRSGTKLLVLLTLPLIWLVVTGLECEDFTDPVLSGPIYPGMGATVHTDMVTLTWLCTDDDWEDVRCRVYFGTDPDDLTEIGMTDWVTVVDAFHCGMTDEGCYLYYDVSGLETSTTYYWRLRASNRYSGQDESEVWNFTTADEFLPDGSIYNPDPDSGDTGIDTDRTLSWYVVNPDDRTIGYDIYLGTTPDPPLAVHNHDTTAYTPGSLECNSRIYWRVVSLDESLDSLEAGPLWFFSTVPCEGDIHDPTPDSGLVGVNVNTILYWHVRGELSSIYDYDVYFGTSVDPPLVSTGQDDAEYDPGTLAEATIYYWRVVGYNATDTSESPLWHFTTEGPPVSDTIFALLEVDARIGSGGIHITDFARARFDSTLAFDAPVQPIRFDSVIVEDTIKLYWVASSQRFEYETMTMMDSFLIGNTDIDFDLYGHEAGYNASVSIRFPECVPILTYPINQENLSLDGFDVLWDNSGCDADSVILTMMKYNLIGVLDSTGVWITAENDGSYSVTPDDLAPLGGVGGRFDIILIVQKDKTFYRSGYSMESIIRARMYNVAVSVYL